MWLIVTSILLYIISLFAVFDCGKHDAMCFATPDHFFVFVFFLSWYCVHGTKV